MVTRALDEGATGPPGTVPAEALGGALSPHPGTVAYARGEALPAPPADAEPAAHDHAD